jgi:hypothetical protein
LACRGNNVQHAAQWCVQSLCTLQILSLKESAKRARHVCINQVLATARHGEALSLRCVHVPCLEESCSFSAEASRQLGCPTAWSLLGQCSNMLSIGFQRETILVLLNLLPQLRNIPRLQHWMTDCTYSGPRCWCCHCIQSVNM